MFMNLITNLQIHKGNIYRKNWRNTPFHNIIGDFDTSLSASDRTISQKNK